LIGFEYAQKQPGTASQLRIEARFGSKALQEWFKRQILPLRIWK
jgi:hypothetical protein